MKSNNTNSFHWMHNTDYWRWFAFYSTNLSRLMPHIPTANHGTLFAQTMQLKKRNGEIHDSYKHLLDMDEPPGFAGEAAHPAIWATFHTGPYHFVCGWLMLQRIPFTLLLSGDVMIQQAEVYSRLYQTVTGKAPDSALFDLVDASNPKSLIRMRAALRKGHQLVAYLDGNVGINRNPQLAIDFFGQKLGVKTGMAYLAQLMNCPVYPVSCRWNGGKAMWVTAQTIRTQHGETREAFVQRCMVSCYQHLQLTIQNHPEQWEGWLYVHHDLQQDLPDGYSNTVNAGRDLFLQDCMPFRLRGESFLIRRIDGAIHPIPPAVYDRVWQYASIFYSK